MICCGTGAALLLSSSPPRLVSLDGELSETGRRLLPEAALHDSLLMLEDAFGRVSVVFAYALAGVQTDLVISPAQDAVEASARLRLPPGVRLSGAAAGGGGSFILAGAVGEGSASDIFFLAVSATTPLAAAEAGDGAAGTATVIGDQGAQAQGEPSSEGVGEGVVEGGGELLTCRFSCLDEESVFPLTRTVLRSQVEAEGMVSLHAAACSLLGVEAAMVEPDCEG